LATRSYRSSPVSQGTWILAVQVRAAALDSWRKASTICIDASQEILVQAHDIKSLMDLVPCGNEIITLST
jgi:hypothetical protein